MARPATLVLLAAAAILAKAAPGEDRAQADKDCPLMVKVLDAVKGAPAAAVDLKVFRKVEESWTQLATGVTDQTGQVHGLITEEEFPAGLYKVEFDTTAYWKAQGRVPFHHVADVKFEAHADGRHHYTLALLLSPYSYTTTAISSRQE
ncbi:transthyretin [Arapaima gigas]